MSATVEPADVDRGQSVYRAARRTVRYRNATVCSTLAVVLVVVAGIAMSVGSYGLGPSELARTLVGGGSALDRFIVFDVRLPRLLMGALAGAALGMSGALLQTLLRNPLASPDLMGISGGASVAAVLATTTFGLSGASVPLCAFLGALAIAGMLIVSACRDSTASYRLILTGVALAFLCSGVIGYLLKRAQVNEAQSALVWVVGSVGATRWSDLVTLAIAVAIAIPAVVALSALLPYSALGDRTAEALGIGVRQLRATTLVTAVLLAASAVAFVGPIGFVALCAPAIARALIGHGSLGIVASALSGAVIVAAADVVAQNSIPDMTVPVGVITGIVGAPYLLWLLATSSKGSRI